ncbi:MAG: hypothetical protein AB1938_18230 [Myxococcota bacterium]
MIEIGESPAQWGWSVPVDVTVTLVTDAREGQVDDEGCVVPFAAAVGAPDALTVKGLCEAAPGNEIRCSAEGVALLVQQPVALKFVLAHELHHLRQGAPGAFSSWLFVDLKRTRKQKLELLRVAACQEREKAIEAELAADRFGIVVGAMDEDIAAASPFSAEAYVRSLAGGQSPECAGKEDALRGMIGAAHALEGWRATLGLAPSVPADPSQLLRDTLCRCEGSGVWPVLSVTHPSPTLRVARLIGRLGDIVTLERKLAGLDGPAPTAPRWRATAPLVSARGSQRGWTAGGLRFGGGQEGLTISIGASSSELPVPEDLLLSTDFGWLSHQRLACRAPQVQVLFDGLFVLMQPLLDEVERFERFASDACVLVNQAYGDDTVLAGCDCRP